MLWFKVGPCALSVNLPVLCRFILLMVRRFAAATVAGVLVGVVACWLAAGVR